MVQMKLCYSCLLLFLLEVHCFDSLTCTSIRRTNESRARTVGQAYFVSTAMSIVFCVIKEALVVVAASVIVFETNKGAQYIDKHFTAYVMKKIAFVHRSKVNGDSHPK